MEKLWRTRNGVKEYFTEAETARHLEQERRNINISLIGNRVKGYGQLGEQLGMIFDELKETGTLSSNGRWFKHIQAVKDANPKPEAN